MSLLRAIKEQLNRLEARQLELVEPPKPISEEVTEPEQRSFGSLDK